ncbi:zinc finger protein 436-like isoform X2 [Armigeres subalbatus]|uniref:zinc finger protein 436-like isoform X2 n=1 Tax=Armigeres subalbatus TaxID=124917 RepID=UPI002ED0E934
MEYHSTVCRLCEAPEKASLNWIELYVEKNEHLLPKIRACANIVIHENDELPRRICDRCHQTVERAYNFKLQCEITDAKLRNELDFMKENESKGKKVPPFDYGHFLQGSDHLETDVASEKVVPKTEPTPEQDEEEQVIPEIEEDEEVLSVEIELKGSDSDGDAEDTHKNDDSDNESETSDSEHDSDWLDKAMTAEKKKRNRGHYKCDVCGQEFTRKYDLYTHRKSVHGSTPFQCKQCMKCFSKQSRLVDHELLHTGIRPFQCPECEKNYATQKGLKGHIIDVHTPNLPYVCDKCGKGFSNETKLRNHYAAHIETRDFICDICEKGFKTAPHLSLHKATHLPQEQRKPRKPREHKPCICPFCGKVSNKTSTHIVHLRQHTGEQRYECHICSKRFTSSGSHKKHLRVHSGEKPYVCQYCQKPFRQKHHMDTHIRGVHTNEKPYQCKFCPRAFATIGNMRLHEKSHGEPASVKQDAVVTFPEASTVPSPASQASSAMMISSTPSPMMDPASMIPSTASSGYGLY